MAHSPRLAYTGSETFRITGRELYNDFRNILEVVVQRRGKRPFHSAPSLDLD
jgi:hypothetical protein